MKETSHARDPLDRATAPRHVAVDLTPLLPGGENGGAKVFILELLPRLARLAPDTRFTLLTQAASHEELAALDTANMARLQVLGEGATRARGAAYRAASAVLAHAPHAVRRLAARAGYALHRRMKSGAGDLMRRLGADVLFCPFTAPTYRAPGVATVCTLYDLQFHAHPEFFTPEDAVMRERAFRDACASATRMAAISEFSRMQAIEYGHIDRERIRTIRLRLARRIAGSASSQVLARLGLTPGRYLLYPANFWKHKNHERLLQAFARVAHEPALQHMHLVFTGSPGEREKAVAGAARSLGVADRVTFAGFVSEAELAALMAGARALVFPSLYEGFGLPVLEAMACSIPVACSDGTALREMANGAALLFAPEDVDAIASALVAVAGDEALRARLVAQGVHRAAEFADADAMAREYWTLFGEALAENATA